MTKRNPWLVLLAILATMSLVAAACGSDDDDGGSDTTTAAETESDEATDDEAMDDEAMDDEAMDDEAMDDGDDAGIAEAQARLDAASTDLSFSYAGSAFDAAGSAAGKTVYIASFNDSIPILNQWGTTIQSALELYGIAVTRLDAASNPEDFTVHIDAAIAGGADVIVLNAIPPAFIQPALEAAATAGVAVVSTNTRNPEDAFADNVTADASYDYRIPAALMADWVAVATGGQAKTVSWGSEGQPSSPVMHGAIEAEFAELCPGCTVELRDAQPPTWSDGGLQQEATNVVQGDPDINYLLPIYDGMTFAVSPGVTDASSSIGITSFNATLDVMQAMQADGTLVEMDVGCPNDWFSYGAVDATMRILAGEEALTDYGITCRVFTKANLADVDVSTESSLEWYGVDFLAEFQAFWGAP